MFNSPQITVTPNLPPARPLSSKVRFEGWYRMQARDARSGNVTRDTGWFQNLILDGGLNRIGTGAPITRCVIGTGTATPNIADTALANFAASTVNSTPGYYQIGNEGSPNYANYAQYGYRFSAGQLNGNYSEVGVGWGDASLWSRALIVDGMGSPTTITVLATEFLDVFYLIRTVPDLTEYTDNVTISGVVYSVKRKPAQVGSTTYWRFPLSTSMRWAGFSPSGHVAFTYTGTLGAVTGFPSGSSSSSQGTSAVDTYVNNSLEQTGSIAFSLIDGNVAGGAKSISVGGACAAWQYEFSPIIPKDATNQLTINGKIIWSR